MADEAAVDPLGVATAFHPSPHHPSPSSQAGGSIIRRGAAALSPAHTRQIYQRHDDACSWRAGVRAGYEARALAVTSSGHG